MNPGGEMFGEEKLREEIRKGVATSASDMLVGLLASVDRFAAEAEQADDISLIVIRRPQ
jgi:serine phosphatase RsbU (regulator of sigma subunit)